MFVLLVRAVAFEVLSPALVDNPESVQPIYNEVGDRVRQAVGATTTYYTLDVEGLPEVIASAGGIYLRRVGELIEWMTPAVA